MDISLCRTGQRYLFYDKQWNRQFRACFLDINNKTLRVTEYQKDETNYYMSGMLTMPLEWIEKVETLETIVDGNLLIPSEIMIEIDGFL